MMLKLSNAGDVGGGGGDNEAERGGGGEKAMLQGRRRSGKETKERGASEWDEEEGKQVK